MKKLFLPVVIFITMSSFTSMVAPDINLEDNDSNLCSIYADEIASEASANGGNYYRAWFYAYAYCDSVVYQ